MKPDVIRADVSKISYLAGDEIRVKLVFDVPSSDIAKVNNISIDLHRVERGRNQFAFGFGAAPVCVENTLEVKQKLPDVFPGGLYVIGGATLYWGEGGPATKQQRVVFAPIFFAVQSVLERPFTKQDVASLVASAEADRHSYIHHEIHTERSRQDGGHRREFIVHIFGVGCLLHSQQQLQGYAISPLGTGLSHRRMHEIVNGALSRLKLGPLQFDPEMERQFETSTPAFLVSYQAVVAVDHNDALEYCRSHAALLFELLGLDRGQKPREFACLASEIGTTQRWHMYQQPWYKGNLVSDFNPVSTANLIERHVPKLQTQPFLRLIVKTFADATAEDDQGFALLLFWSVMELMADKYVQRGVDVKSPNGSPIYNAKGKPETTNSKHGRVYHYILSTGTYAETGSYEHEGVQKQYMIGADSSHPGYTLETELLSLWDMVRAAYAVRNAIAHEGQFNLKQAASGDEYQQLAARLILDGYADPRRFIQNNAHLSVMRELNNP